MLSSTSTSSPPSCNVANRKAKDGRKLKRLWRCKFGACQQQRAPTGNGIGGRCLMSVEAQAADDVRRFVRISNIGRPRTPRQPDQKSPTKRVARARQSLRNVNGTSEGQACDSKVGGRQRRLTSNACLEPTNYKLQTTNYKLQTTKSSVGRGSTRSQTLQRRPSDDRLQHQVDSDQQ
jgi:hypothetical protein